LSVEEFKRAPKRELDLELDRLEAKIAELRVLYEQYFIDILPQPPDKLHTEVIANIRTLLRAPFKNSATRFRLRTLIQRFQTYSTYWERVNKQREDGTYNRDLFKAEMRQKFVQDEKKDASRSGAAERGMRQLFQSYEEALNKTGQKSEHVNFDSFKKSLVKRAQQLKKQHGAQKLSYKIAVKDGKVVIKASIKKQK